MLKQSMECWNILFQKHGIKYLSTHSACPHITISAGKCADAESFKQAVRSCLPQCMPITIQANGLGIFVKETPVIYIRWLLSRELMDMRMSFQKSLVTLFSESDKTTSEEVWLPKSTLAINDVTYDQLPLVLNEFKSYKFEQKMLVNRVMIMEVDRKEVIIDEISLD